MSFYDRGISGIAGMKKDQIAQEQPKKQQARVEMDNNLDDLDDEWAVPAQKGPAASIGKARPQTSYNKGGVRGAGLGLGAAAARRQQMQEQEFEDFDNFEIGDKEVIPKV